MTDNLTEQNRKLQEQVDAIPELVKMVENATNLSRTLAAALEEAGVVTLNGVDITQEDIIGAVKELANGYVKLSQQVEKLRRVETAKEIDLLIQEGRVPQSKHEFLTRLKLSAPETFDELLKDARIVEQS